LQQVWPLVAEAYARVWDAEGPPSATDLRIAIQGDATLDAARSASEDGPDD